MYLSSGRERQLIIRELFSLNDNLTPPTKLTSYFKCFDALSSIYTTTSPSTIQISLNNSKNDFTPHPTFNILAVIRALKNDPSLTRNTLYALDLSTPSPSLERELAININSKAAAIHLGVHLMLMIDCSVAERYPADYNIAGVRPLKWNDEESFPGFVERAFRYSELRIPSINFNSDFDLEFEGRESDITAFSLQTYGHLRFVPTDNLIEHLLLDIRRREVKIFHHTPFLKAQLRVSMSKPLETPVSECLTMGILPPQLLLETLYSIQSILFPSHDEDLAFVLDRLLKSGTFDPDMCVYEGPGREDPEHIRYRYWGARLSRLYDVARNPEPTSGMQRWLERNAKERNVLYIGIIALVLNAVFGLLIVAISCFQAWISWRAWTDSLIETPDNRP
ncbi:hypothetical protein BKA64DRAFT_724263 [Cadophora sp. MPI-SDFR-AT-0126]|nr:hypothetical protein BKA64DRAFT_724263 [Leotiomycetes sp. MPI-SDFR-AT-0126]